jgi:Predicted nucleic acid-binding protein, contains PIN domain
LRPVYLLDTCVVSEATKPHPSEALLGQLAKHEGICAITSIVLHELRYGIERLPEGHKKRRLFAYLNDVVLPYLPIFPYDDHAALLHAEIRVEAAEPTDADSAGRTIPFVDGMIAAVAMANNLVFITRNVDDFRGINRLMIENWFEG